MAHGDETGGLLIARLLLQQSMSTLLGIAVVAALQRLLQSLA
ncbi:MAG: hypothetical protein ABW154_03220 [Dyella sp.]